MAAGLQVGPRLKLIVLGFEGVPLTHSQLIYPGRGKGGFTFSTAGPQFFYHEDLGGFHSHSHNCHHHHHNHYDSDEYEDAEEDEYLYKKSRPKVGQKTQK